VIIIDAFFRFSGIGLMLLLCVIVIRDLKKTTASVYFLFAFLTLSIYFLGFVPNHQYVHWIQGLIFKTICPSEQ